MLNTLKKQKRLIIVVLLLFITVGFVSAKASYSPSIQGNIAGSFIFPTADYLKTAQGNKLPAMRTSASFDSDIMAANFSINNFEFGAGFAIMHNTKSLAAGNQFIRAYTGMGVVTGGQYHFYSGFSLGAKFRYMFNTYFPLKNRFDSLELEAIPGFDVVKKDRFETTVTIPVTIAYKNDLVAVRVGVGFDVQYNLIFGAKHEEN